MALARVVTFDGVSKDRMAAMQKDMEGGDPPEGFPSSVFGTKSGTAIDRR